MLAQQLVDFPDDVPGSVHDALGVAVALPVALPVHDPEDLVPLLGVAANLQRFAPSGDTIPAHRGVPDAQGTFDYVSCQARGETGRSVVSRGVRFLGDRCGRLD
jgi:hypothetical protein